MLNHPLNDYVRCIPWLNVQALAGILDRDIAIWKKKTDERLSVSTDLQSSKESNFFKLLAAKKQIIDKCTRKSQQVKSEALHHPLEEVKLPEMDMNPLLSMEQYAVKVNLLGFKTVLTRLPIFGDKNLEINQQWPEAEDLKRLPLDKKIKLSQLSYKSETNSSLQGLQLGFTNGVQGPPFETKCPSNAEWRSVEVDSKQKIRKVLMCVHKNNTLRKVKLLDEVGRTIVQLVWYDYEVKCRWVGREIPADKEIIGLYGSSKGGSKIIQSLGLVLWTPNRYAKD